MSLKSHLLLNQTFFTLVSLLDDNTKKWSNYEPVLSQNSIEEWLAVSKKLQSQISEEKNCPATFKSILISLEIHFPKPSCSALVALMYQIYSRDQSPFTSSRVNTLYTSLVGTPIIRSLNLLKLASCNAFVKKSATISFVRHHLTRRILLWKCNWWRRNTVHWYVLISSHSMSCHSVWRTGRRTKIA